MKSVFIHIILLICSYNSLLAQNDGISYLNFDLQANGEFVTIRWEVIAGNTCQDVEIWRSSDSLNFENIYTYAGICGDDDSNKVYQYIDKPAANGRFYYYQIKVFSEKSLVKKVLTLAEDLIHFYPNPASNSLNLIHNANTPISKVEFYNSKGQLYFLLQNPELLETIDISHWGSGVYIYKSFSGNTVTAGQVIKE